MLLGQMMATQPPGRANPLHLGQARVAPVTGRGGEDGARDDQIGEVARDGQVVEEPAPHAGALPMAGLGQLPLEYLAQPGRRLDGHHLLAPVDEFQRQPP